MELDHADQSLDGLLGVLADHRRRTVLHVLSTQPDNVATVDEVVRYLNMQDQAAGRESAMALEQLEIELHHRHLPKLEEQGLIRYDTPSGRIEYHPDEKAEALLEFVRGL